MSSEELIVAALAIKSEHWALDRNIKSIEILIRQAAKEGAKIVCTPEVALQGYFLPEGAKGNIDRQPCGDKGTGPDRG